MRRRNFLIGSALIGSTSSLGSAMAGAARPPSSLIEPFRAGLEALRFPRPKPFVAVYGATESRAAFVAAFAAWSASLARSFEQKMPSLPEFQHWYRTRFGRDIANDREWQTRADPGRTGISAEVSRAQSLIRDTYLFDLTTRRLESDRRLLVVFGGSHLASLWRAFQHQLGKARILA